MPNHDGFLGRLWEEFPQQVYLVGKYDDPRLELPADDTLRVFIPDLHWLSKSAQDRYPKDYGFTGNNLLPDGRRPLFGTFLKVLEKVRDKDAQSGGGRLEVYQLGDAFDLWREKTNAENDASNAYRRIREDPIIGNLADRLDALSVNFVSGNHDHWLPKVVPSGQMSQRIKKEWTAAGGKIRLTHGHEYSALEMGIPDDIQAAAVHFWRKVEPSKHGIGIFSKNSMSRIEMIFKLRKHGFRKDFYPKVDPDGACLIEKISDIQDIESKYGTYLDVAPFSRTPENANDFSHVSYLQFADDIIASEFSHPKDHSVHAIGHTHGARLLVDRIPPGRPHVTLDCGGWLGLCNVLLKGKAESVMVPSAQIGVQYGNDIRIYQLGGAE